HRQADLLEIVFATQQIGRLANFLHGRQQQRQQHADDRDHHQQFDQTECLPVSAHDCLRRPLCHFKAQHQEINPVVWLDRLFVICYCGEAKRNNLAPLRTQRRPGGDGRGHKMPGLPSRPKPITLSLVTSMLLLCAGLAGAQTPESSAPSASLEKRVHELEETVRRLEAERSRPAAETPMTSSSSPVSTSQQTNDLLSQPPTSSSLEFP